jgi:uncharacterized protein YjbI with pentapeptide repeats
MNTDAGYVLEDAEFNHCQYSLATKQGPSLKSDAHLYRLPISLGIVPDNPIQPFISRRRDRWNRKNQVIQLGGHLVHAHRTGVTLRGVNMSSANLPGTSVELVYAVEPVICSNWRP